MNRGKSSEQLYITPDWPAPECVKSLITTYAGGASLAPFATMNLASHVGDHASNVQKNRSILRAHIGLDVLWLNQVHGTDIVTLKDASGTSPVADGAVSRTSKLPCAVLTADCLPILLTNDQGDCVSALHAGWRGLAAGVVDAAVDAMFCETQNMMAYIGPAISLPCFEVGKEVIEVFQNKGWPSFVDHYHASPANEGKFFLDLAALAKAKLWQLGVQRVYGGHYCTYRDSRFYSYRRDGTTGRFATLIWIN